MTLSLFPSCFAQNENFLSCLIDCTHIYPQTGVLVCWSIRSDLPDLLWFQASDDNAWISGDNQLAIDGDHCFSDSHQAILHGGQLSSSSRSTLSGFRSVGISQSKVPSWQPCCGLHWLERVGSGTSSASQLLSPLSSSSSVSWYNLHHLIIKIIIIIIMINCRLTLMPSMTPMAKVHIDENCHYHHYSKNVPQPCWNHHHFQKGATALPKISQAFTLPNGLSRSLERPQPSLMIHTARQKSPSMLSNIEMRVWCTIVAPASLIQMKLAANGFICTWRSLLLGTIGMPGNSAYFGLLDICQPKVMMMLLKGIPVENVGATTPHQKRKHAWI